MTLAKESVITGELYVLNFSFCFFYAKCNIFFRLIIVKKVYGTMQMPY